LTEEEIKHVFWGCYSFRNFLYSSLGVVRIMKSRLDIQLGWG